MGWLILLSPLRPIGVGKSRSCVADPKEMSKAIVQNVRWPHPTPQITKDRVTPQPEGGRAIPWRVWGCVEVRIWRAGGRGQGVEDVRQQ